MKTIHKAMMASAARNFSICILHDAGSPAQAGPNTRWALLHGVGSRRLGLQLYQYAECLETASGNAADATARLFAMTKASSHSRLTAYDSEPDPLTPRSVNSITHQSFHVTVFRGGPRRSDALRLERDEVTFGHIRRWRTGRGHRLRLLARRLPEPDQAVTWQQFRLLTPKMQAKLALASRYWRTG